MKRPALIEQLFILAVLPGLMVACDRSSDGDKYSGDVVLTSERILTDTYRSVGFSFREGKNVPYPPVGGIVPDIVVTNETDIEGNITGATFSSPNNLLAFHLERSFSTINGALDWYREYREVTTGDFTALATPVMNFQVWTMRTADQKYAKLVIKSIQIKTDSPVSDYIEVTVEYRYQPDGTKFFTD